jgi:hypothetical protein
MGGIPLLDKPLRMVASYVSGRGRVKQIVASEGPKTQAESGV